MLLLNAVNLDLLLPGLIWMVIGDKECMTGVFMSKFTIHFIKAGVS